MAWYHFFTSPGKWLKNEVLKPINSAFDTKGEDLENVSLTGGLGNSLTGNIDYQRQLATMREQNAFSASEAEKAFQRNLYMTNTAHQREVADLKSVGLNPYLTHSSGAVLSSPTAHSSSSSPQHSGQGYSALVGLIGNVVNNAFAMSREQSRLNASLEMHEDRLEAFNRRTQAINNRTSTLSDINSAFRFRGTRKSAEEVNRDLFKLRDEDL